MAAIIFAMLPACGGDKNGAGGASGGGVGGGGGAGGMAPSCMDAGAGGKGVAHVVIVVQENHTFDAYFGSWCTAPTGSKPMCTSGPSCCEAAPAMEPKGASPIALDDTANRAYDPDHHQSCELEEINKGMMDGFVMGSSCSDPRNFAIATDAVAKPYRDLATQYALADHYFQPIAGQSASNDMYLAVAKEVFLDNTVAPNAVGDQCSYINNHASYTGQKTIADLLSDAGKTVGWYSEGYGVMKATSMSSCPPAPPECLFGLPTYPCVFDPSDVPFLYYKQIADDPKFMRDYSDFAADLAAGKLPDVSFVKAIGYHSEHPGYNINISDGTAFVTGVIKSVEESCYKDSTLVLVMWDEGGGFFDHMAPPPDSAVDNQPYGTRVPFLAVGRYAKKGFISHVEMEHSSIVKFLEYNFLDGKTGQLGARDAVVNNIGSLLDPVETGVTIPDK